MNILAIGNSFSQDALRYLHDIAASGGYDTHIVNLFIGGCSLETHFKNMQSGEAVYDHEINGQAADCKISLADALAERAWDVITLQQCSGYSGIVDSYYPFANELAAYVRRKAPGAKLMIHQTWAYDVKSDHPHFPFYDRSQNRMYSALSEAYNRLAETLRAPLIPVGDCIQTLRETEEFHAEHGRSLCRDGYHLHLVYGRYAAAACWYECVIGGDITTNGFIPDCPPEMRDLFPVIRETVHRICTLL